MVGTRRLLYLVLPFFLLVSSPSPRELVSPAEQSLPAQQRSIRFAHSLAGNNYAFGVSVQTGNSVDATGYSTTEGFQTFSYHIDEQGRTIVDSGIGF